MRTALGYIGIDEVYSIAIENTAVGGAALDKSVELALVKTSQQAEKLFKNWK